MKLELRFKDDEVKKALAASAKRHIKNAIVSNAVELEAKIKQKYGVYVRLSPEYKSLVAPQGFLRKDFGIEEPVEALRDIIDILLDSVVVKVSRASNEGLSYIIPLSISIFNDVGLKAILSSSYASYVSDDNSNWSGARIEWLRWLLLSGSEPVVMGYHVVYGDYTGRNHLGEIRSRTGEAIMIKNDSQDYSVDERFQGTKEDNFLTRAAIKVVPEIEKIIQETIIRKL